MLHGETLNPGKPFVVKVESQHQDTKFPSANSEEKGIESSVKP
jgi:hypothetical protein